MTQFKSRLRASDLLPTGTLGLRSRRARAVLSGLGIAIGIASMVAVLGVTRSSQSDLLARIDRLGTNLLTVVNAQSVGGDFEDTLSPTAAPMIRLLPDVLSVAPTAQLGSVDVFSNDHVPPGQTGGLSVRASDDSLLTTLDGSMLTGRFLNPGPSPIAVLGYDAATTLGIKHVGARIWLGGHWFVVAGILAPVPLAQEIDRSALVSFAAAEHIFGIDGYPTRVFVRSDPDRVPDVADVLAGATEPADPFRVAVSRPSDALTAKLAAKEAGSTLILGLGAIALIVGAIGIANVMVISVLERRSEIGLRRALGAARLHVAAQFLTESLVLSALGGAAGLLIGAAVTSAIAYNRGWTVLIPAPALWGGIGVAIAAGAIAGLYPALRAARIPPTDALRTV
jgi:putative ABC transport system permease protein